MEYALVNYALRADRSYLMRKAALRRRMSDAMTLDEDDDCGFLFAANGDSEAQSSGPSSASPEDQNNPASLLASEAVTHNHVTHRRSYIHPPSTNLLLVT